MRGTARAGQGIIRWEPVDLAAVTGDVLAARREQAARNGVNVDAALRPAMIPGDPRLVAVLVSNLVDNALRHNVPGGMAEVRTFLTAGPGGPGGTRGGCATIDRGD